MAAFLGKLFAGCALRVFYMYQAKGCGWWLFGALWGTSLHPHPGSLRRHPGRRAPTDRRRRLPLGAASPATRGSGERRARGLRRLRRGWRGRASPVQGLQGAGGVGGGRREGPDGGSPSTTRQRFQGRRRPSGAGTSSSPSTPRRGGSRHRRGQRVAAGSEASARAPSRARRLRPIPCCRRRDTSKPEE